jgi:hypothetical protein
MTTLIRTFRKDPDATLDYGFDWEADDWLSSGETITDSVWTVQTGLTKDSESNTETTTTVWLSGGTAGEVYTVANQITTSAGRIDERTFGIVVENR